MTSLSIVIPCYNAEKTISDLCKSLILQYSKEYSLEIVLINDFSKDGTDAVCKRLQADYPETIIYARLSRNFGEHSAVMAGLNLTSGEYVVTMDDDFQNPPDEIKKLLNEITMGFDVVYSQYSEKMDSLFRNIGSYLNGSMARVILHKPANLYLSSFKIMNRFLVDELITYKNPNPYIDAIILRITRNIGMVDVRHDIRKSGTSGYSIKKLAALWGDMLISYSLIPLRIFAFTGLIFTILGCFSVIDMYVRDLHPFMDNLSELEELTSITMFFRGFQLFATGIVGEYVGRIYLKMSQEPQFIIREKIAGRLNTNEAEV
jgi:undecaprenyl-phosphate 4-deoxy-4-formamido-L-arabinose transferase